MTQHAQQWYGVTSGTSSPSMTYTWDSTEGSQELTTPEYIILEEDQPWVDLYEYDDYVGIMHAMMAREKGWDDEPE